MKFSITLFLLVIMLNFLSIAQPKTQPYGKVDIADLQLKECDFEKDANAMVLFDKCDAYFDDNFQLIIEMHKRIKIFNDKGNDESKIRLEYRSINHFEQITDLQAETINLENDKPVFTKVDKKQIFNQNVDKYISSIVFTFSDLKPGSIIEYKYKLSTGSLNIPTWYFQSNIPERYSEIKTSIPDPLTYRTRTHTTQPYIVNSDDLEGRSLGTGANTFSYNLVEELRGMGNIPSLRDEPFMSSRKDNLQSLGFQLANIKVIGTFTRTFIDNWDKVGKDVIEDEDFGSQLKRKLTGEELIVAKAKSLKTNDEKIAYIFNEVRTRMKWNDVNRWYTIDGTAKAWDTKTGNGTEINLILYHLLKLSGLDVYPMLVSTKRNGKVNPAYPFLSQFNHTVAYIPVDSLHSYVLDASNKYNTYNEIPVDLLDNEGFKLNKDEKKFDLIFLAKTSPAIQSVFINADITPDGKMKGNAEISSDSYYRLSKLELYQKDGEEKFKTYLTGADNNLKITNLKIENADIDTLPLVQKVDFNFDLNGSDADYIYVNSNLFTSLHINPFLAETRMTDIDFGYCKNASINGIYKLPQGYKIEALPKNVSLMMPDKTIVFRRLAAEQEGKIVIRYTINYKKTIFFKENYGEIHDFFKQMFEMLNEQIVLKKS